MIIVILVMMVICGMSDSHFKCRALTRAITCSQARMKRFVHNWTCTTKRVLAAEKVPLQATAVFELAVSDESCDFSHLQTIQ